MKRTLPLRDHATFNEEFGSVEMFIVLHLRLRNMQTMTGKKESFMLGSQHLV